MPPAALKTGSDLTIQVDSLSKVFHPGSVITGRVIRSAHAVSPMATVEIRLCGRAKAKIGKTRSNGQSTYTTYYRGRFNFFDGSTARQLYSGPLHVAPDGPGEAWPFEIQIPLHPSPDALLSEHDDPKSSFLPLGPGSVASSPLPGSFAAKGRSLSSSTTFDCYVEYYLEASLLQQSSHGSASAAALPVVVLPPPPPPRPLASPPDLLQRHTTGGAVSTYRLLPGLEDAHLSLRQKTQKLFHSSRVPGLRFAVGVDAPGTIRLGHPSPVPFRIGVAPDRRNSSEAVRDVPLAALVASLELVLKARTHVVAPGNCGWTRYEASDAVKHKIVLPVHAPAASARPASAGSVGAAGDPERLPAYERAGHVRPVVSDEKGGPPAYTPEPPSRASEEGAGPSLPLGSEEARLPPGGGGPAGQPGTLALPIGWGGEEDDQQTLDVGAALDLRVHPTCATALGRPIADARQCPIYPSFVTYCIRHSHSLKWKLALVIAGESVKFEGEVPVSVVGPSQA